MRKGFTALVSLLWTAALPAAAQHPATAEAEESWAVGALEVLEQGSNEWRTVEATAASAAMGCKINLSASNTGSRLISIVRTFTEVRNRLGWWKPMFGFSPYTNSHNVRPGGSVLFTADLDFACNVQRRYRFAVWQWPGTEVLRSPDEATKYMYYYPSSDSFTTTVDVKLGNLNRFFR